MQAWDNFLAEQEKELGAETVQKWLRSLKLLRFDACNLYLEAKDSFQTLWFEEHIRHKIQSSLVNNNQRKIKVHLSLASSAAGTASGQAAFPSGSIGIKKTKKGKEKKEEKNSSALSPPPNFLDIPELDPLMTFDNFLSFEENLLAYKLLQKLSIGSSPHFLEKQDSLRFNPIYIYGASGTGKTHLLMATAAALASQGLKVIYISAETFIDHVIKAIRAAEMSLFRQTYRSIDVLIVDDVHIFSRKTATQEEFFHTFNTLHLAGKKIILGGNCTPQELQYIEPRLVSRFEWGIVLPLENLKKNELLQILTAKAKAMKFPLSAKISEYLLENFTSSAKALMRALHALILRSHLHLSSGNSASPYLTPALAKTYLSDLLSPELQSAITSDRIIQTVADYYGIRKEDILGKSQNRESVLPRQIVMHLCREKLKMPYMKIGDIFSRDHSTVMSSIRRIQKEIEESTSETSLSYYSILKKLQP